MKIYENLYLVDGSFKTAKKFLTIKVFGDDNKKDKNMILKSFKAYSKDRILLYDDFLEAERTFYRVSNEQKWIFDYNDKDFTAGAVVIMEIKYYNDKNFSKICFVKTDEGQQDWKKAFVYDAVDEAFMKLEGYEILRNYWKLYA